MSNNSAPLSNGTRHDMRNHLNNIAINAELIKLLAKNEEEAIGQIIASAEKILAECKHCSEKIDHTD